MNVYYVSDRQRVEALLFPQMLWAVVEAGVADKTQDDYKECQRLLREAMDEPVRGLRDKDRGKIVRRCGRVHLDITAPYRTEATPHCDKIGLIVYFLIKSVVEDGYLVFGAGSAIDRALDLYLPAIAHLTEEPALFASSRKHARKVLEHLQRLGYFGGVPFAEAA